MLFFFLLLLICLVSNKVQLIPLRVYVYVQVNEVAVYLALLTCFLLTDLAHLNHGFLSPFLASCSCVRLSSFTSSHLYTRQSGALNLSPGRQTIPECLYGSFPPIALQIIININHRRFVYQLVTCS